MELSNDKYNELSHRIDKGEFLTHPATICSSNNKRLPTLAKNADTDTRVFHNQCQQILDLYLSKIKALEAQVASERKKQESNEALENANAQTVDFNSLLEDKYAKLLKKSEEEARSNKKAIKSLQELSDKVLEENKRLKEENDRWQATFDKDIEEISALAPSQTDLSNFEAEWEAHKEMEEWETNSISKSVKEVVKFCVNYVSNIDDVSDSHVEPIKDMMEDLLESSLAESLVDSDKLQLTKDLHAIKKNRKQQQNARNKEITEKAESKSTTNNNFYAPVGQQVNSASNVISDNQTKS